MQVHGILHRKFDTQRVSDRFQKREFVLETNELNSLQYPTFMFRDDKCIILDMYKEGDEISVDFNLLGREWNGPQGVKYFTTLEAWRIQKI